MGEISLDRAFQVPDDVVFREIDGEAVVLNLKTGLYFGLDPVGTRMWQLISERGPLSAVAAQLLEEFDVDATVLQDDLLHLVEELSSHGLVRPAA